MTAEPAPRRRDAARTRQLLLDAARARFARDGYSTTTLRDVADDAGVNIALISRYFDGKEGLFAASLSAAADDLRRSTTQMTIDDVPAAMADRIAGAHSTEALTPIMMLLLRSSGDETADRIRLGVLAGFGESLATAAGWSPADPDAETFLMRAHVVLAATIGILLLRSVGLAPLATVDEKDLVEPLRDLVGALLPRRVAHSLDQTDTIR